MISKSIYTLPNDFSFDKEDVEIYFYSHNKTSTRKKVVFTKNMFCLLQKGYKEIQTAHNKEIISNCEMLMLTSGSALMTNIVTEGEKYEAILIFFDNKTLSDLCMKRKLALNKKTENNTIFKIFRDDFLNNFCHSLNLLHKEDNTNIDSLKVQEILGYIASKYPEIFQKFATQALTDIKNIKIKQIVELNSNKNLTIEELAVLCNMSISTFKRHFIETYEITPQKYFTQLKMEQAKSLLCLRKRPSEIYYELGYKNLSAFSKEFKKYSGISPKEFQNKNGF